MAHSLDLTVTHSLIVSAFHPTSFTDSVPMTSGEILSFLTNLVRNTEMSTLLVNVKNTSLHPITGIIICCWLKFPTWLMFSFLRLRSVCCSSSCCDFRCFRLCTFSPGNALLLFFGASANLVSAAAASASLACLSFAQAR